MPLTRALTLRLAHGAHAWGSPPNGLVKASERVHTHTPRPKKKKKKNWRKNRHPAKPRRRQHLCPQNVPPLHRRLGGSIDAWLRNDDGSPLFACRREDDDDAALRAALVRTGACLARKLSRLTGCPRTPRTGRDMRAVISGSTAPTTPPAAGVENQTGLWGKCTKRGDLRA